MIPCHGADDSRRSFLKKATAATFTLAAGNELVELVLGYFTGKIKNEPQPARRRRK
jgi:hypothetical protein